MPQVTFYHTADDGSSSAVATLTLTPPTLLSGDERYLKLLLRNTDRQDAAALAQAFEQAPERFDGGYLRASYMAEVLEPLDDTAHGLQHAVVVSDTGVVGAVAPEANALKAAAPTTPPSLDELAEAIAVAAETKKVDGPLVRQALLEPWLASVFGTPESNQLQKVAARTFGFPDPPGTEELQINWKLLYPMGALYNLTQAYLKARGFTEWQTVPVYRPYMPSEARTKQWQEGDEVRIKLLPLTSWTLVLSEAAQVAQALGTPSSPTLVLKTFIPISSIVSTPWTGIGIPGTGEVVLAGGEYEALVEKRYG